ncbi:hypothetical protein L6164_020221 [Bauhinia variegata]|uniref:Uncharacterized protein n=1 Tax=Bauhinia variegata TaxID=167791 RepID=A0ACB9MUR1_BAUVA|nr:hypothetical protein L6164_020221 [Bauhinia variegata]
MGWDPPEVSHPYSESEAIMTVGRPMIGMQTASAPFPKRNRKVDLRHLCAWGNDAASEVLTEARLLLVENYFQTPS